MRRSKDTSASGRTGRGRIGEAIAACFLQLHGFEILDRNVRDGPREVDLIATDDRWWIVVEVRLRKESRFGAPEDSVGRQKREQLLRVGRELWCRSERDRPLRFDLISMTLQPRCLSLRHHPFFMLSGAD